MLKRDSQTNQAVALNVVQPEKLKAEMAIHVHNVKCILLYAPLAAKKPQYLFNLLATNLFIAAIAINRVPETTGKSVSKQTLSGSSQRGFLFGLYYKFTGIIIYIQR